MHDPSSERRTVRPVNGPCLKAKTSISKERRDGLGDGAINQTDSFLVFDRGGEEESPGGFREKKRIFKCTGRF